MKLSQRMIERAKPTDKVRRIRDGMGLYLEIRPGKRETHRHFVWRGTIAGAVTEIRLGKFPWLSLEAARDLAIDFKRKTRRGEDPRIQHVEAKQETRKTTLAFIEAAREAFAVKAESVRDTASLDTRLKFLERNAAPLLRRPVDAISPQDVVGVLKPIWGRPSAKSMRADLRASFNWATAAGFCDGLNPAGESIDAMLPRVKHKVEGRKAVHYSEMPEIMRRVESADTAPVNRLAWMFMALTAARPGEALGARWSEIEGDAWIIPAERMKAGRAHSVPLCGAAMDILKQARNLGAGEYVFPSPQRRGKPISRRGLESAREAAGIMDTMQNHGCRSVFKTWASEQTRFAPDVVEQCLAHAVGSMVERAYSRGDSLERRREVHEAYCRFLVGSPN